MNARIWRFLQTVVRLVVEETAQVLVKWASRRKPRNRRPWQDRRE